MVKTSVIIPVYNEAQRIKLCLDSIRHQTIMPNEVIVVDNNSTDATSKEVERYFKQLPISLIFEPHKGRGQARYTGFAKATGTIIFSTDADTILPTNWIEEGIKYLQNPDIIAITGPSYITDSTPPVNYIYNNFVTLVLKIYGLLFRHYCPSGFNFAVKKDAYHKTSGFDSSLNAQEDTEFGFRLRKVGHITYCDQYRVEVSGRRFNQGIIKGIWSYIWSFIRVAFLGKKAFLKDVR